MREILFRGKCVDTGKWYEGQYINLHKTTFCFAVSEQRERENEIHQIVFERMTDWNLPNEHLRVDVHPETVGQYTGLTDKDGNKIFEGDILEFSDRFVVVVWHTHLGCWDSNFLKFTNTENGRDDMSPLNWGYKSKVIGNIHDNPELSKGGAE